MKTIYITLLVVLLSGCKTNYPLNQYNHVSKAFIQGCELSTIESSLVPDGNTLKIVATCTKEK